MAALIGAGGSIAGGLINAGAALWNARDTAPAFRIADSCSREGQMLTAMSEGFDPGGEYVVEVRTPAGRPYRGNSLLRGVVTVNGDLDWVWRCTGHDRSGVYRTRLKSLRTGEHTAWVAFSVNIT
ncbi:hypothetical protein K8Z49_25240 [Actinomadura madurae]|uniref:hypothetical protein n=1 Tax=Actinomadura madurae TaxID=1993 RepID=UPI003999ADB2